MLTMVAGWQCGDIRNTMYAGMVKSAERAPMFKGKVKVGYKRVVLVDTQARPVSVGGGRVRTTLEKDYSRAETMQALEQEFDRQPTLSDVVSALRVRGIDRQGGGRFQRPYWMGRELRMILNDPVYVGEWRLINGAVRSDVWAQFARKGFDPAEIRHEVPHLAWFTKAQVARWREKFLSEERPAARRRKYIHPLLGVLSCAICGTSLQRGATLNVGPHKGDLLYRCMGRRARVDHEWAVSQRVALAAMREILPEILSRTADVVSAIWAKLASGPEGSAEQRLAAIEERERFIRDKWLQSMRVPPQWLLGEIQQLDEQKRRLQEEAAALGSQRLLRQRAAEVLRICGDPSEAFDGMTPDQQSAVWQALVTDVRFGINGGRGRHRKVWVSSWKPVGESISVQSLGCSRSTPSS